MEYPSFLFVANWKMQKNFDEQCAFIQNNAKSLQHMTRKDVDIIICPSFVSLTTIHLFLQNTAVLLGAQDCSEYGDGPYTGQISAHSLAQIGCAYGIVGHSERRYHNHETNEEVARKVQQLLNAKIKPIICVGETADEHQKGNSFSSIQSQLKPIATIIQQLDMSHIDICIAYEPIWSIGTGNIPSSHYLHEMFSTLDTWYRTEIPKTTCRLIYGGSVDEHNVDNFYKIPLINGLIIGNSSLNFQKFKKIVSLFKRFT